MRSHCSSQSSAQAHNHAALGQRREESLAPHEGQKQSPKDGAPMFPVFLPPASPYGIVILIQPFLDAFGWMLIRDKCTGPDHTQYWHFYFFWPRKPLLKQANFSKNFFHMTNQFFQRFAFFLFTKPGFRKTRKFLLPIFPVLPSWNWSKWSQIFGTL